MSPHKKHEKSNTLIQNFVVELLDAMRLEPAVPPTKPLKVRLSQGIPNREVRGSLLAKPGLDAEVRREGLGALRMLTGDCNQGPLCIPMA